MGSLLRVLAVDPGPHTGLATRDAQGVPIVLMIHNDLNQIVDFVLTIKPEVIVVERFATGGRMSGYGHETIEIIGVMRGLAYALGARFYKQTPQSRYAFSEDSKTQLGRRTQHEWDAYSHLLRWEYDHRNEMEQTEN